MSKIIEALRKVERDPGQTDQQRSEASEPFIRKPTVITRPAKKKVSRRNQVMSGIILGIIFISLVFLFGLWMGQMGEPRGKTDSVNAVSEEMAAAKNYTIQLITYAREDAAKEQMSKLGAEGHSVFLHPITPPLQNLRGRIFEQCSSKKISHDASLAARQRALSGRFYSKDKLTRFAVLF